MRRRITRLAVAAFGAAALTAGAACAGDGEQTEEGAVAESTPDAARLATAEFDVKGMTCGGCALAAEAALKRLDGVASADARYDDDTGEGRCTVEYDPTRVEPERMIAAIRKLGFEPTLLEAGRGG